MVEIFCKFAFRLYCFGLAKTALVAVELNPDFGLGDLLRFLWQISLPLLHSRTLEFKKLGGLREINFTEKLISCDNQENK